MIYPFEVNRGDAPENKGGEREIDSLGLSFVTHDEKYLLYLVS